MSSSKYQLSEESAQAQLDLFDDFYGIDIDETLSEMDPDDRKTAGVLFKKIKKAIRRGDVEIDEVSGKEGEPTLVVRQRLQNKIGESDCITYREVTGRVRAATRPGKGVGDSARMYQFLGLLTGDGDGMFRKLRGRDVGVTDLVGSLFLLV